MKHLIDEREPITLADIDRAIADGLRYLDGDPLDGDLLGADIMARLLAIVRDTYGKEGFRS